MSGGATLIQAQWQPDPAGVNVGLADAAGESLAARLAGKDPTAFDELVVLHQARITRLVHRLMGWRGDVDDVVQDVFLAALNHGHRFRGEASLATWLTRIAINTCRSHQRRLRVLWKRFVRATPGELERPEVQPTARPGVERDETAAAVREAIRALSPRDREVVVLRYFDDLSPAEIATMTGQSKNAVEVRLHRARARLGTVLRGVIQEGGR